MYSSLISATDLELLLGKEDVSIIDCRFSLADDHEGKNAYLRSHIPGAIYAHLNEDLSGTIIPGKTGRHPLPEIEDFVEKLSSWGIGSETQVVVYDQIYGGIAARLWWMLQWLGHTKVAVLDGGWMHWKANNHPSAKGIPTISPKIFVPKLRSEMVVDATYIENHLKNKQFLLIDSRAEERYKGEEEPIDPVAGHIPGAISAPFLENMNYAGTFQSTSELRERFEDLIQMEDYIDKLPIFYCGSGVTACHNILSLFHSNQEMAKLYPGSWSDWITDKSRAVEKS